MSKRTDFLDKISKKETKNKQIPVGFWFHFLENEAGQDYFNDPSVFERNIQGHKRYSETVKPDFIKLMSDGFFIYPSEELLGTDSIEDVDLSQVKPLTADHPWIVKQVDLVNSQIEALQEEVATFYNIFAPANYYNYLFSSQDKNHRLVEDLKLDPEKTKQILDVIAQSVGVLVQEILTKTQVDGIYYSVKNIQDPQITNDIYRQFVFPSDQITASVAAEHSQYNILHICGYEGAKNDISIYQAIYEIPEFPIINWAVNIEDLTLHEGEAIFQDKFLLGGFDNTIDGVIYKGTKEEIDQEIESIINSVDPSRLIVGADCTVPFDIEYDRITYVKEQVHALSKQGVE